MLNISWIAHLLALLVFVGLCGWLVQTMQRLRWLVQLLEVFSGKKQDSILVDWPDRFIRRFSSTLSIPTEVTANAKKERPQKIDAQTFFRAFLQLGITSLKLDNENGNERVLTVYITSMTDRDLWQQQLRQALGGTIEVRLRLDLLRAKGGG